MNEVCLLGRAWSSSWSADLVHTKGLHRSFQPSMNVPMARTRSLTLVSASSDRLAGDDPEEDPMLSHDPEVGVKCQRPPTRLDQLVA